MKTSRMWAAVMGAALIAPGAATASGTEQAGGAADTLAQSGTHAPRVQMSDWSGPRMGFMFAPGDPAIARRLSDHGLGNVVSQFGWQFERRVRVVSGGPELVTEVVPLFGGVEYGKLVPSLNALMGVRFHSGVEFGMGPSLSLMSSDAGPQSGLLVTVGKSFNYGDMCIPLNLAVSTNPNGTMVSLIAGYAINRAAR